MDEEHLSSLERVRRKLYSTTELPDEGQGSALPRPEYETRGWDRLKVDEVLKAETKHLSAAARFLLAAVAVFIVTLIGAGAYLYFGGGSISTKNVVVSTSAADGNLSRASGDVLPLFISIDNKNPTALRGLKVTVTYPEGTRNPDNPTQSLPNHIEEFGDVESGGHAEKTIRAMVFGSEGEHVTVPITIQYKTDGSTSVFEIQKEFEFDITSSPLTLTVQTLSEISSGQPFTVDVLVKNSATTNLDNVAVGLELPFGFTLTSTEPKLVGPLFHFGTLTPGEERRISITGVASGEDKDERVFKFTAGVASSDTATTLTTPYSSKDARISLTKPFLGTELSINHDSGDAPVVTPGAQTQALATWVNNLTEPISNAQVTIKLAGDALDYSSVRAGTGFYRSSDSTIVFNGSTNPSLKSLAAGATGQGAFTFATKNAATLAALRSPSITMTVSISGQRIGESNVPETVSSTLTRTIRVGTNLTATSKAVRTVGQISNTGPWPPEPNKETTYTVQFTISNSYNPAAGVKVTAALPTYVRYTGKVVPNDGSLSYNETNGVVTWNVGDVEAGTAAKTISFQVGLTPSVSQSGSPVTLVDTQTVTGTDRFTQKQIQGTVGRITTEITSDPAYASDKGIVQ